MRTRIILGALVMSAAMAGTGMAAAIAYVTPDSPRELNAKINACNLCHGSNGVSKGTKIPIIWGQQENYVLKQLEDFRTEKRHIEVMTWQAETLADDEVKPVAAWFAKQAWPMRAANTPAAGAAPRGIAVCQACHAQNFQGAVQAEGMSTPRLAGQRYEYLVQEMNRYADGERTNNADMASIMKGISAADRDAMAKYLSAL